MEKFMIYIPIRAIPKERVAWNKQNGKAYTKKRTRGFEASVGMASKQAMGRRKPIGPDVGLKVTIVSVFQIPKSWTKAKKLEAEQGDIIPIGANIGDVSNLAKSIEDGMNGIVYVDDKQIVELVSIKKYGDKDEIFVLIEEFGGYNEF